MVFITGDIHGQHDIGRLKTDNFPIQKNLSKDDYVIICGDFGCVWNMDNTDKYWLEWLNKKNFTTLFIDGNHENHDLLKTFPEEEWHGGKIHRISDKIIHLMRGQVFEIEEKKFFTMGGAESHDKNHRKKFVSWWSNELPSDEEYKEALNTLEKNNWNVDYVITHCCGGEIENQIYELDNDRFNYKNKLTVFFDELDKKLDYKQWFFGHYHVNRQISEKHYALFYHVLKLNDNSIQKVYPNGKANC